MACSPALALPEVLQVLIVSAVKLCADDGVIYLKRGDVFVAEADFEGDAEKISARNLTPRRPGRESVTGRVALSGQVEQIPDNRADPEFAVAPGLRLKGIRSMLGVPLLRGGEVAGVFVLGRRELGLFSDRAVEQARTFADQAVIAIENARLFDEVQAKTRDLEESLAAADRDRRRAQGDQPIGVRSRYGARNADHDGGALVRCDVR